MLVHNGHLVIAKPIDAVLAEQHSGVVDQKLPDLSFAEGKDQPSRMPISRKVNAVPVIRAVRAIIKMNALVVEVSAGMVVDNVGDHRQSVDMTKLDERLELV